jgi:glucose/arabinose dehydrogenase
LVAKDLAGRSQARLRIPVIAYEGVTATARSLLLAILCLPLAAPGRAAVLDPNWTETTWLATALGQVSGMAWAPDGSGRLFLTVESGQVRIVNFGPPPALVATPFATITPINTGFDGGLMGLAFDPNFVNNRFVYFFVTVTSSEQQIIRYTDTGGIGTGKTTIIGGIQSGPGHHGGAVLVGRDGKLYWGDGDNGTGAGADLDLASLASKIGRANRDGNVPADNPFVDGGGPNNDRIFARGFRNPFTATFQPSTGTLWVDDVGELYEQIFAVEAGEHAGWNDYENNQPVPGPPLFYITPKIKYVTNGTDTRTLAAGGAERSGSVATFTTTVAHLFRQGERITIAGVTDASFNGAFYVASTPTGTTFTVAQAGPNAVSGGGAAQTQDQGGCLTGGTFFDSTGAPPAYRGNLFYGDCNTGRIMRAVVGPGTTVQSVDYFVTDNTLSIDVSVGPDGALYYVGFGGTVKRAAYTAVAQGLIASPSHLWMDEGGKSVFTVRLATAPAAAVTVDVARESGSSLFDVLSGATLTFTPANFATPQVVTIEADAAAGTDAATFTVTSVGLTTQRVEANSMNGAITGYEAPGRVPNGDDVPGLPLTVRRNAAAPMDLDLDWSPSCGAGSDYSVHEGLIGAWYSHDKRLCSTNGATAATLTPRAGNTYYLIVPLDRTREGSYGEDSSGDERVPSISTCRPGSDDTACP